MPSTPKNERVLALEVNAVAFYMSEITTPLADGEHYSYPDGWSPAKASVGLAIDTHGPGPFAERRCKAIEMRIYQQVTHVYPRLPVAAPPKKVATEAGRPTHSAEIKDLKAEVTGLKEGQAALKRLVGDLLIGLDALTKAMSIINGALALNKDASREVGRPSLLTKHDDVALAAFREAAGPAVLARVDLGAKT